MLPALHVTSSTCYQLYMLPAVHVAVPSPGLLGVWPPLLPQLPQLLQVPRSLLVHVQMQVQMQVQVQV